jgi:hypothetical protein
MVVVEVGERPDEGVRHEAEHESHEREDDDDPEHLDLPCCARSSYREHAEASADPPICAYAESPTQRRGRKLLPTLVYPPSHFARETHGDAAPS